MTIVFFSIYLFFGSFVGFLAGLFGIGGGIFGIPLLFALLTLQGISQPVAMPMAIQTFLAIMIVTSISGICIYYREKTILFSVLKKIILGSVLGSILGVILSHHLTAIYLQRIFGVFLLCIAAQMFLKKEALSVSGQSLPKGKQMLVVTIVCGIFSGMFGLGGGLLMVPYLTRCGIPIRNAVATATACILPVAIVSLLGHILMRDEIAPISSGMSGIIYWPAFLCVSMMSLIFTPVGVRRARIISPILLRKLFSVFLMVIGLVMLFK